MTDDKMIQTIGENFGRWLELRGLNPNKVGVLTQGKITAKTIANIKGGKVRTIQLRSLVEIAKALNESPTTLVGVCLGELEDPLTIENKPTINQKDDVLISSTQLDEANVQNLQLMVQLLKSIKEEIVGLRNDFGQHRDDLKQLAQKVERSSKLDAAVLNEKDNLTIA